MKDSVKTTGRISSFTRDPISANPSCFFPSLVQAQPQPQPPPIFRRPSSHSRPAAAKDEHRQLPSSRCSAFRRLTRAAIAVSSSLPAIPVSGFPSPPSRPTAKALGALVFPWSAHLPRLLSLLHDSILTPANTKGCHRPLLLCSNRAASSCFSGELASCSSTDFCWEDPPQRDLPLGKSFAP